MKLDEKNIKQVIALFDDEDIKYIDFEKLYNDILFNDNDTKKDVNSKVKVKKLGDKNDRRWQME